MTTIVGNTTDAVELRYTNNGTPVANITVAVTRKEREQEVTDFHDVTLWGSLAENAASLDRGTRVVAVGTIKSRKYETREGQQRTAWFLDATAFGPELRWATAQVTKTGGRRESVAAGAPADSWSSPGSFGDDTPF